MKISISKYKGFEHENDFFISPLTLIFGNNNAGKSSVTRLVPSLSLSMRKSLVNVPFYPASLSMKHNLDFFYSGYMQSHLSISLDGYEMQYTFLKLDNNSICVEKLVLISEKHTIELINDLEGDLTNYSFIHNSQVMKSKVEITFNSILPDITCCDEEDFSERQDLYEYVERFYRFFKNLKEKCYWIGPLRYFPSSVEDSDISIERIGTDGYGAIQILSKKIHRNNNVFNTVNNWFIQLFDHSLNIDFIKCSSVQTDLISISLSPINNSEIKIPLCDCGMGISQVFPILVQLSLAYNGLLGKQPILIFENPELHLHDGLHKDLGNIFVDLINIPNFNPTLIIETHSENILLAMQIAVAKKKISNEKININWVYKNSDKKSSIKKIEFLENGLLSEDTLNHSFSTTSKLARELFLAVRGQK